MIITQTSKSGSSGGPIVSRIPSAIIYLQVKYPLLHADSVDPRYRLV